jgi:hypothetical protein
MRPDRLQTVLADAARHIPAVDGVKTLADAGHSEHPYGIVTHLQSGAQAWWSFTVQSRPGDDYAQTEQEPVTGDRPEPIDMPVLADGPVALSYLEQALASQLLQLDKAGEIKAVSLLSTGGGAIPFGLRIDFHDTAKAFVNSLATVGVGQNSPRGRWYEVPATV